MRSRGRAELVEAAYCVAQVQPPALAVVQGDACVAQGVTGQGHHQQIELGNGEAMSHKAEPTLTGSWGRHQLWLVSEVTRDRAPARLRISQRLAQHVHGRLGKIREASGMGWVKMRQDHGADVLAIMPQGFQAPGKGIRRGFGSALPRQARGPQPAPGQGHVQQADTAIDQQQGTWQRYQEAASRSWIAAVEHRYLAGQAKGQPSGQFAP